MNWTGLMPNTPDELLAEALRRDIGGRLSEAMYADPELAAYLVAHSATVNFDVVIDRALTAEGALPVPDDRPDNQPFAAVIAEPTVIAMVDHMRRGIRRIQALGRDADEEFCFEIVVNPHDVWPVGA